MYYLALEVILLGIQDVLPSGKNIHALDPQSIPTTAAVAAAKSVVDKLIERTKRRARNMA